MPWTAGLPRRPQSVLRGTAGLSVCQSPTRPSTRRWSRGPSKQRAAAGAWRSHMRQSIRRLSMRLSIHQNRRGLFAHQPSPCPPNAFHRPGAQHSCQNGVPSGCQQPAERRPRIDRRRTSAAPAAPRGNHQGPSVRPSVRRCALWPRRRRRWRPWALPRCPPSAPVMAPQRRRPWTHSLVMATTDGWSCARMDCMHGITESSRIHFVLLGMQNTKFGPCLATIGSSFQ
jgi:hypothetical protein